MNNVLISGLNAPDVLLTAARVALGSFFILARFRFFYDPSKPQGERVLNSARIASLTNKMTVCGIRKYPLEWAVFVAVAEVAAGIALVLGLFSVLAAAGLLAILLYATRCTCHEKVTKQNPVDEIDVVCCYLWTAEPLYMLLCLVVILGGSGAYSLDALLF